MSTLRSASYALGVLVFAGICAGCAVDGPKSAALYAPVASLDAPGSELLFVSDRDANSVSVFSLPYLTFMRKITAGLDQPSGLCGTPDGDVWVANYGDRRMLRFHPDGKAPFKEIKDQDGYPFACSADGTLAYANKRNVLAPAMTPMSGPGETWVGKYSYNYPALNEDVGVAWQNAAPAPGVTGAIDGTNLYIVGKSQNGKFVLAVLRARKTMIHQITVTGGTIHDPGMVQWYANGDYLAVGDRHCGRHPRTTCVYHIKIKGLKGRITGETTFETYGGKPICDMAQGVIETSGSFSYLVGGDNETPCKSSSSVDRWAFPTGGMPINFTYHTPPTNPFGTAISN